jgi:glucose/arabinose dehydrogenase/mono/diheme cytochrome c family protein
MKIFLIALIGVLFVPGLQSCRSTDKNFISSDPAVIHQGEKLFNQHCSGCHNFRQHGIGPQLSGITTNVSVDWIRNFIKDSKLLIETGDKRARELYEEYHTMMPSYSSLPDDQIDAIIAFLNTHKSNNEQASPAEESIALSDPIPDSIMNSNLVINLRLIAQFPPSGDIGKLPLTRITKLGYQPGSNVPFVLDLRGKLYRLENDQPAVYMDMATLKPNFIDEPGLGTGFGSFAFHPDFFNNGLLYTTHTEPAGTAKADFYYPDSIKVTLQWVVTEWKVDDPKSFSFSGTGRELFRANMVHGLHGIQEICFDPFARKGDKDYGLLYLCIGDGGSVEVGYPFLAHNLEKIYGTILRIDPAGSNSRNGNYGLPPDNPFINNQNPKTLKEIYAYGFRNPHRISWSRNRQLIACNIGQHHIESLCLVKPGDDYGWPIREGSFRINPNDKLDKVHPLPPDDTAYHIIYPVAEYDHDEGRAISGGFEYQGKELRQLKGKYLFGDIPTGRLFFVNMADLKRGTSATISEWKIAINGVQKTLRELSNADRVDLHFGRDANGELYILTKADGKMYKLTGAVSK